MKIINYVPTEINLNPGDRVNFEYTQYPRRNGYRIVRLVETTNGVYVVFNNSTWRPISTYGKTWWKVEEA